MDIKNRVIGVLGTAKNTGKTTSICFILEWTNTKRIKVGLTSIGYDGEDIDNITGLPKPRIYVKKGNLVGTAEQCLSVSEAKIEIIEKTPVKTSLGQVLIGKVLQEGLVVLAGPNKGKDLLCILQKLKKEKSQLILVDGALNRMIPLIYCDALILATGASRLPDIHLLVEETKSISFLYQLPLREEQKISNHEIQTNQKFITIFQENGTKIVLNSYSLINQKTADNILKKVDKETREIYIPGIIQDRILLKMIEKHIEVLFGKAILINNPAYLLIASQDIDHLKELINEIQKSRIILRTLQNLPILAVTINPFYPNYNRCGDQEYEIAWIDRQKLYEEMSCNIHLPVINIKEKGSRKLIQVLEKYLGIDETKNKTNKSNNYENRERYRK